MSLRVSVAIPAFNASQTIQEAISSVLRQTHEDLEIVVCDDASSDGTSDIIRALADPRIRILRNESNYGEGVSRDRAIAAARGDWIAVLDADDAWHPERLASLLLAAGSNKDSLVFDDILICHHTSSGLHPWRPMRGPRAFHSRGGEPVNVDGPEWAGGRQLLIKPIMPMELLKSANVRHSDRRYGADSEFFLRLIASGARLRYLPRALYYYRITPGSMSAIRTRGLLMSDMLEQLIPIFKDQPQMVGALRRKIAYRQFLTQVKAGPIHAARAAYSNPSLAWELASRAASELPYFVHRMIAGAEGRF